jgi:hypothetical protein
LSDEASGVSNDRAKSENDKNRLSAAMPNRSANNGKHE